MMELDEAIKHCLEVAEQNDFETRIYDELNKSGNEEYRNNHCKCAADHRQLAEWLTELRDRQWISVDDRLPSENTLVLCYARSTTGEGNGYFLGALAHGEFWFLKVNDIGHVSYPVLHWEVTHWQPLPESPKED